MPATFSVHHADGTQIGSALTPSDGSWQAQVGEDGSGRLTVRGDQITAAQLAETTIVRVNDGTRDVFAFVPTTKDRRTVDSPGQSEVSLSGPGVRWLLHAGQVLQEDTTDCAEPANARWLGWMSAEFDDTGWEALVHFGKYSDGNWVTPRPEDWPDPDAYYVWTDEGAFAFGASPPGDCYFRWTFTVAEESDVVLLAAGDDEYRLWLDGTEMFSTLDGGPHQWQRFQSKGMRICPGQHVVAVLGRNLQRVLANLNYGWVLWSLMPADENGEPLATNQRYKVYHDHTGGTFTLTVDGQTTAAIAWNANADAVKSALEALTSVGAGNVTVTGAGVHSDPWDITFDGDLASSRVTLTGDPAGLTGGAGFEIDEWARGSAGEAVARSDLSGKVLPYPATAPGLTAGEILRVVMEEVQGRGETVLDHVSLDFSDPLDTAGTPWPEELTFPVSLPADVHRVAVMLEEMGYQVDVSPSLALQCWQDRGADLSATVTLAPFTAGVGEVSCTVDETTVANVIRYRAGDGWYTLTDDPSVSARGRWEAGLSLEAFATRREALSVVRPLLDDLATPPRTTTVTIPSEADVVPYDDFGLCDVLTGPLFGAGGFDAGVVRVTAIGGAVEERSIVWTVELVD